MGSLGSVLRAVLPDGTVSYLGLDRLHKLLDISLIIGFKDFDLRQKEFFTTRLIYLFANISFKSLCRRKYQDVFKEGLSLNRKSFHPVKPP